MKKLMLFLCVALVAVLSITNSMATSWTLTATPNNQNPDIIQFGAGGITYERTVEVSGSGAASVYISGTADFGISVPNGYDYREDDGGLWTSHNCTLFASLYSSSAGDYAEAYLEIN